MSRDKISCQIQDLSTYRIIKRIMEIDRSAFVVGGFLRELLKGRETMDIDIVTRGDIKRLALSLATDLKGKMVIFKKAGIIRVVSDNITIDFSELQGSIHDDLSKRDFTMNAIAWSPFEGVIDPFRGMEDIQKGIIRAISKTNLKDDPLRLLRAYRFVAESGFKIDNETRSLLRRLKKEIRITASERITAELFKILNSRNHIKALRESFEDGLLREILSIDKRVLLRNIESLSKIDRFVESIRESLGLTLEDEYSQGLTFRGLIRLERLLIGSKIDRNRLTLSKSIWKRVKALSEAFRTYTKKRGPLNSKTLFEIFCELKEASVDFSILTNRKRIFVESKRFLDMKDNITGDKIAELTGLKGKEIGEILKKLRYLQFASR